MANDSENWFDDFNQSDLYFEDPFEDYDYHHHSATLYAVGCIFAIVIIVGVITNVLGLTFLIRCKMWLRHEGYFYLVGIFAANIGILIFDSTSFWLVHWHDDDALPIHSSEFVCKVWHFFMTILFSSGWLSVALLFNVYLREHLVHRRRCGCPRFAAKYCTLLASKIIVGVIFGVVFILALPYMWIFGLHSSPHYETRCRPHDFTAFGVTMFVKFCLMWVLPFVFFMPVFLCLTLCLSREGDRFGFSQLEERSVPNEQFRVLAVTFSSMTLFSQFVLFTLQFTITVGMSNSLIQTVFALSLGFQPLLCLMIVFKLREEVLQQLRSIGCCKRFIRDRSSSSDTQTVRLQEVQEIEE